MSKFLVLSLPRSRSLWMAHFLRYAGRVVPHDLATECASIEEFKSKLSLCDGSCETGAVLGWRLLRRELPELKLVVVRRPWPEVIVSLFGQGVQLASYDELIARAAQLDLLAQQDGVLVLEYRELWDPEACRVLFEHCLELPFDWQWWSYWAGQNVQIDMSWRLQRLAQNHERLEAFKAEVAERSRELEGSRCLH